MINLFVDTSYKSLFIAILNKNIVIDKIFMMMDANFSEVLIPSIKELLEKNKIKLDNIDKIFVTIGPGSFTGIRIGVTVCKTLGFALNKTIIPLSSLEFMATTKVDTEYKIPYIDARHGFVFAGVYDSNGNNIIEDKYCNINELIKEINGSITFISYDGLELENTVIPNYDVSSIVLHHLEDSGISPHQLKPNYLKKSSAEENLG